MNVLDVLDKKGNQKLLHLTIIPPKIMKYIMLVKLSSAILNWHIHCV